jgi:protein disulfide-isomerase
MKLLILKFLAIFATSCSIVTAENNWIEDFEVAKATAVKEKKWILMNVTGSDICDRSALSEKMVFSVNEFKDFAKENLVLFNLDFPNVKPQSAKIEKQNEELVKNLKVPIYSHFMLLDSEGNKFSFSDTELGYDAVNCVARIKELLAKAKK